VHGVIYRENSRKVNERLLLSAVKFQPPYRHRQLSLQLIAAVRKLNKLKLSIN